MFTSQMAPFLMQRSSNVDMVMLIQDSLLSIWNGSNSMRKQLDRLKWGCGMTKNSKVEDKRKYHRFPLKLQARYLQEDDHQEWKDCTVTNISRKGMGIEVYLREKISIRSILHLEIIAPKREKLIKASGVLMWIKDLKRNPKYNFVGGVELTKIDPDDKWTLLDHAYNDWYEKEKRKHGKKTGLKRNSNNK